MERTVRVRLCGKRAESWLASFQAGMRSAGIDLAGADEDACATTRGPPTTLVLFDSLSPEVLATVDEVSRGGRDRTLAIATNPRALDDSRVWQMLMRGASDVFAWGDEIDSAAQVAARLERWARIDGALESPAIRCELVGTSPQWLACLRQVVEMAVFSSAPVLLLGESGTGKELLARLVHSLDQRPGPMIRPRN